MVDLKNDFMKTSRRHFIYNMTALAGAAIVSPSAFAAEPLRKKWFDISLAEWSLHRALFQKKIEHLDFPRITREEFGIGAVEYVNTFFKDKAEDTAYLNDLLRRSRDHNIKNHLIMIDGEGNLGDTDEAQRKTAVENHFKWVNAAKLLGCTSIRVNAYGKGTAEEVQAAAISGLGMLGEYAAKENINVIVENHGSYSSNGQWMSGVLKAVGKPNVGMLPDFGNFCIRREDRNGTSVCVEEYDRYKGVRELMPYAKAVSAKSMEFDEKGNCIETDYAKMMKIVRKGGFRGYIGIEFEGSIDEYEGIRKTKVLLERFQ